MARSIVPPHHPFVIALFDEIDPAGSTVVYGDDPEPWAWLTRPVAFAAGREFAELTIPGTRSRAHVTIWAPENDKAQHLTRMPSTNQPHPSLIELDLGPAQSLPFRASYARLVRAVPKGRVFEGAW